MIVSRKVFRQGHSQVVTVPELMLEWIGLDPDTRAVELGIVQNKKEKLIVIRAVKPKRRN